MSSTLVVHFQSFMYRSKVGLKSQKSLFAPSSVYTELTRWGSLAQKFWEIIEQSNDGIVVIIKWHVMWLWILNGMSYSLYEQELKYKIERVIHIRVTNTYTYFIFSFQGASFCTCTLYIQCIYIAKYPYSDKTLKNLWKIW